MVAPSEGKSLHDQPTQSASEVGVAPDFKSKPSRIFLATASAASRRPDLESAVGSQAISQPDRQYGNLVSDSAIMLKATMISTVAVALMVTVCLALSDDDLRKRALDDAAPSQRPDQRPKTHMEETPVAPNTIDRVQAQV